MKPFKRILRPTNTDFNDFGHNHILDERYSAERFQLVHAYHIIEKDFKKLFDFIELNDNNKKTFSHRIYELILRTCTEFESNCKGILEDNDYVSNGNLNITDYFKINDASKLNGYEVRINIWTPKPLIVKPFDEWDSEEYKPLTWYKNYNSVKHNRNTNFNLASLENLVNCMAGLFVILASQFAHQIFSPYQITTKHFTDDEDFISVDNSVFSLKFPKNWDDCEIINFNWNEIKETHNPFDTYQF